MLTCARAQARRFERIDYRSDATGNGSLEHSRNSVTAMRLSMLLVHFLRRGDLRCIPDSIDHPS